MFLDINPLPWFMSYGLKSAFFTLIALLILTPLAPRLKLIDHPTLRKQHLKPTPLIGGVSIFIGLSSLLFVDLKLTTYGLLAAAMLLLGVIDDRHDLRPKTRLLGQSLIIVLAIFFSSMRLDSIGALVSSNPIHLGLFSPIVTLFLVLTFINAINMLDGLDGLVASIISGQAVLLLGFSLFMHELEVSYLLSGLLGALFVFLFFNLPNRWKPHARVFLGDAGSTFLAFIMTWIAIDLSQKSTSSGIPPITIFWCVYFPFMEIYSTCALRRSKGVTQTKASHDHLHFLLMKKGYSKNTTRLTLLTLSIFYGLLGIILFCLHVPEPMQFLFLWINCFTYTSLVKKLDNSLHGDNSETALKEFAGL